MRIIDINEWVKFGEGVEADSFNNIKDKNLMLKLYKPYILKKRIEDSFYATNEYLKLGINTPKAYEIVVFQDRMGVIYEKIEDKISLYRMFVNDHEKAEEVAEIFGSALREFHKNIVDKNNAVSRIDVLERITKGMLEKANYIKDDIKKEILDKVKKFYDNFRTEGSLANLCMGDCHIGNVILANNKLYFIDLSQLQYGSPLIDIGWLSNCFGDNKLLDSAVPEDERIPLKYKKIFKNKFCSTYFKGNDSNYIEEQLLKAGKFAEIQNLFLNIYLTKNVDEIIKILSNKD